MLELKDLLAEWKTVPELLGLGVGAEEVGNGKGISSRGYPRGEHDGRNDC